MAKKTAPIKLTEQEKETLANLNKKKEQLTAEVSSIAEQNLILRYREKQADIFYEQIVQLENQIGRSFTEKYGNGTIDIENGVFISS
jgi:hypothetical protein